jgi:FkbM family methyltransferase
MINPLKAFTVPEYLFRPSQILVRFKRGFGPAPQTMQRVKLPWGATVSICPSEVIGARLWYYGIFDMEVAELIARLLDDGETALDIGANIGLMTTLMSSKVGRNGKVFAFEPHPAVFQELERSVASMECPQAGQVLLHQLALSNKIGEGVLDQGTDWRENRGKARIIDDGPAISAERWTVKLATLDSVFDSSWRCDVCKIDVEGHEIKVLEGARSLLSRGAIRDILFEDFGAYPSNVQTLLRDHGYQLFSIHKRLLGPQVLPLTRQPTFTPVVEGENFLATLQPARALDRCSARGWKVLRYP